MKQITAYINEKLRLTSKRTYTCQPKSKDELLQIILQRIENEGNECDLNDIDVSKITDMSDLGIDNVNVFKNFNGDISQWDVSNVEKMNGMFWGCKKFNCDLSMWDVSNVKYMNLMFYECEEFNCDLSKWDVSNVNYINHMFYKCKKFNQNLNSWNVSSVKSMWLTFKDCPTKPTWYDKDKCED